MLIHQNYYRLVGKVDSSGLGVNISFNPGSKIKMATSILETGIGYLNRRSNKTPYQEIKVRYRATTISTQVKDQSIDRRIFGILEKGIQYRLYWLRSAVVSIIILLQHKV